MTTFTPDSFGLKWSAPKVVANGQYVVRNAEPTPEFSAAYRAHKESLKSIGLGWSKRPDGKWVVVHFASPDAKEMAARAEAREASRKAHGVREFPAPGNLRRYPYQNAGISEGLERGNVLIADEMGLGKTGQAIGIIDASGANSALIVCPASLKLNWERELGMWMTRPMSIGVIRPGKKRWPNTQIVVINYDLLSKYDDEIKARTWDVLVCDECHALKGGGKTLRGRMVFGNRNQGVKPIRAQRKIMLTGTPIMNRPVEIWPIIHALEPQVWSSFMSFARRYCDYKDNGFGMDAKGASNLEELQDRLRETCVPGNTLVSTEIGEMRIDEIVRKRLRLRVWSRDSMGRISLKPIVAFNSHTHRGVLVKVRHATGSLVCTPDHRIFTSEAARRADEITTGDNLFTLQHSSDTNSADVKSHPGEQDVLLTELRWKEHSEAKSGGIRNHQNESPNNHISGLPGVLKAVRCGKQKSVSRQEILFRRMSGQVGVQSLWQHAPNAFERSQQEKIEIQARATSARDIQSPKREDRPRRSKRENVCLPSGEMESTARDRRAQESSPTAVAIHKEVASNQDHSRASGSGRRAGGRRESIECRDGDGSICDIRRYRDWYDRHRSGRGDPRIAEATIYGQSQGFMAVPTRVLSVEVLELGDNGESSGSAREGTLVYDIEVEGNHNFFANGILVHNCMIRRLKADVLTELPPKTRQLMTLPSTGAEHEIAAEIEAYKNCKERIAELRVRFELAKATPVDGDYKAAIAKLQAGVAEAFAVMSRMRKAVAIAKLPVMIEHIESCLESGSKIVAFCHHREVHEALMHHFKDRAVGIIGGDSMDSRQAAVDAFQRDPSKALFVGSLLAAGTGITLTASSHVIMCELDWVPANMVQGEDRCHRIGARDNVLSQWIVLEGSLDSRMATTLMDKAEIIERALDRRSEQEGTAPTQEKAFADKVEVFEEEAAATKSASRDRIAKEAERITPTDVAVIHHALQYLAALDRDGARQKNQMGFARIDSQIGRELANTPRLTARQAALGLRIVKKYAATQLSAAEARDIGEIWERVTQ